MSERMDPTLDALVVGAGPVGLMMAGELARHGLSCRVIDGNDGPSTTSKALAVHSRTLEIFEDIGALDEALARGRRIHANNVYADDKRLLHVELDELDAPYPMVLDLPQSDTEEILERLAASRGVKVERRTRLTALAQDESGVRATLDDGREEVRARWLLGCDGAHSTARHALDVTFDGAPYDSVWLAADVALDSVLPDDEFHAFLSPEGALAVFPLPSPSRARIIYDRPGDAAAAGAPAAGKPAPPSPVAPPTLEEVQVALSARTRLRATISDPRWLVGFRIHRRIASSFRKGRVFLAGDAAHIHSPLGGQGMNTGIQDAYNLAWKLALVTRRAAPPALLDSYQAERHPVAAATLQGTDLATQLVTLRHPAARWARDRLAEVLSGVEVVQQRALRSATQVAVGYRKSPIVAEHRGSLIRSAPRARRPGAAELRRVAGLRRCAPPRRSRAGRAVRRRAPALRFAPGHPPHPAPLRRRGRDARRLPRARVHRRSGPTAGRRPRCLPHHRAAHETPRRAHVGRLGRPRSRGRDAPAVRRRERVPLPHPPGRLRGLPQSARRHRRARRVPDPHLRGGLIPGPWPWSLVAAASRRVGGTAITTSSAAARHARHGLERVLLAPSRHGPPHCPRHEAKAFAVRRQGMTAEESAA